MPFRYEYSAARAQGLAGGLAADARRGVNHSEEEFGCIMAVMRTDLARGLPLEQI